MGSIQTDRFPVIFSATATAWWIGFYNTLTDTYIPVISSVQVPDLDLTPDYYITGQSQRNYKECSW